MKSPKTIHQVPATMPPHRRRWLFTLALALPVLLLFCLGILAHESVDAADRTNEAAGDIDRLKDTAVLLLVSVLDNETGQRGYVLTQEAEFLEPYHRSLQVIPPSWRTLDSGITQPHTRERLQTLRTAVDLRLQFAAETVELQKSGQHEASVALVSSGKGKSLMDRVRAEEKLLESDLKALQRGQMERYLRLVRWDEWISWSVVGVDGLFACVVIVLLLKLRRSEQLLHVCAWSKTVEYDGEWITFEQYLARRFGINVTHGISPAEADKMLQEMKASKTR